MSKLVIASCQRRSTRTPSDRQLTTVGRCNVSYSRADQSPTCYEGDSEDGIKGQGGDYEQSENSTSLSHPAVDSASSILQQPTRQLHMSMNLPHTNRQLRGCNWGDGEKVTLLVDSKRFTISPNLLAKYPNTMLGRMFTSVLDLKANECGEYEVAKGVSALMFRAILDYYKTGIITIPGSESIQEMKEACDYFLIPFNEKTIRTNNLSAFLNEMSNDGAKDQFTSYLINDIIPVMVHCARKGERECQIVILMEDDIIDWDDDDPPSLGEERIQRVVNNDLYHFFKYFENRDIAKDILRDKGLKKIRIGIEGYPTTKEKVRVRQSTGRTEVVYNYVQRPFLRISWEKEEAKSRHVDFTTVKVKTDIAPDAEAATLLSGPEDNFDY